MANYIPERRIRVKFSASSAVCIVLAFVGTSVPVVHSTISVVSELSNDTVVEINDAPARFVPERVTFYGIQGYLLMADPEDACENLKPPPNPYPGIDYPVNWILLARRYNCKFQTKIENAQNAGYSAIIIHNVDDNGTQAIVVEDATKILIYACFIGEYDGLVLKENFTYRSGYYIRIQDDFSLNGYLLPFAIVVGLCFIVMLLFMVRLLWQQITRWIRDRRRSRRRKLPASALKKLPIQKWTKGDPYETCAICLDDFVEQDQIRVLPCAHGFHGTRCIDPWLTKGRRVCPICKRKVVLADEHFSDSGSDTDDDTAPLIGSSTASTTQNPSSGNSTFVQQEGNSFRRNQRRQRNRNQRSTSSSMNQTLLRDSDVASITSGESQDTSSTSSGSTNDIRHNSCPVLAEVHHMGAKPRHYNRHIYNPQRSVQEGDGSHSPTYQSCQNSRSQSVNGEENAVYVPENETEEGGADTHHQSIGISQNGSSDLLAAGAENGIEIAQPTHVSIVSTFNNPILETSRTRRPGDAASPGSSNANAIV